MNNTLKPKSQRIGLSLGGKFDIDTLPIILSRVAKVDLIRYIEINANTGQPIIGGKINPYVMREVKKILADYDFEYTVHREGFYDLRDISNVKLNEDLFKLSLEYTKEIGASIYVEHFTEKSKNEAVESQYEKSLAKIAQIAARMDIVIGLEHIEIDYFKNTLDCIKRINHPNLKMTFDFGHAFLTSKYFKEDFLGNIKAAKPYLCHIHIHDNTGNFDENRLTWTQKSLKERLPQGKGDLHLPIGWGNIPFKEAFEIIGDDYAGIYMLENSVGVHERYLPGILENLLDVL